MTETKTIHALAGELSNAFEERERANGEKFLTRKDNAAPWVMELIRAAHDNGEIPPNDTTYAFISRVADALWADEVETEDEARDTVQQMEPDCYTSDLTDWLNQSNSHIYYLTQALEEFGGDLRDGFQLLGIAQQLHIQEVGNAVVTELVKLAE